MYLSEFYRQRLHVFSENGKQVGSFRLGEDDPSIDRMLLSPAPLSDDDRSRVRRTVRRVDGVYGFSDRVALYASSRPPTSGERLGVLYPDRAELVVFDNCPVFDAHGRDDVFVLTNLAGSYSEGLIGVLAEQHQLMVLKEQTAIRSIQFEETDNPLLIFLRVRSDDEIRARASTVSSQGMTGHDKR